jgi:hypothetical protein
MGPIRCLETSVNIYHTKPCNTPEDRRFHVIDDLMTITIVLLELEYDIAMYNKRNYTEGLKGWLQIKNYILKTMRNFEVMREKFNTNRVDI